ncbi:hypothetical protein BDY24DRAFT_175856 [Mrakia frigida]|uniref:uncharacterized protein n=1 Tax=Mrakia frigida TaxID=29902 RepID=UPI003FCC169C
MGACGEGLGADTLTHHHNASKALVSELGHLARVARVFRDVVASSNPSPIPTSPSRNQEAALKAWATGLPPSLQFDETNLSGAVEKIFGRNEDSTGGPSPGGERGHGFATIHTTAEVCMFFHISSVRNAGLTDPAHDEFLISRQSQAVENITFVLSAIGEKGRRNPFSESSSFSRSRRRRVLTVVPFVLSVFFPLLIVSQWRNSSSSSSDPRLAAWSSEALALWGISSSSDPSSNLSPLISSPSGLSSDFSPFSLRSPTLLGNSPSSPASSLRNGSSSTRLPSISSLTGGRDRSNSNLSTSHPPIYSVPALPSGARAHRSDSTSSLGGASFPSFGATGSPVTLPIPVPSGSPSWLYTGGMGSGAGYFEGMSPRSWDQGLTGRRSAGDEEEQRR